MNFHIHYLDDIILLCAILFPGSITSVLDIIQQRYSFTRRMINNIVPYIFLLTFIIILKGNTFIFFNLPKWYFYIIALVCGVGVLFIEYYIGAFIVLIQYKQFPKGIKVSSEYKDILKVIDVILIIFFIICEELISRQAFFTIFYFDMRLNIYLIFFLISLFYGLNHLFYGLKVLPQKIITGLIYTGLYYFSGFAIIVPIIAHVVQNCSLIILSKKEK